MLIYLQLSLGVNKIQEEGNSKDSYLSKRALLELTSFYDTLEDVSSMHFGRYSLSWPKFNALIRLYMAGERGLTQSELSKKMLVSRANITGLIERLEKEDLVVRGTDPSDKRVLRVSLSNRAAILMNAFLPVHNNFINKVMSALNTHEKEVFISLLEKLKKGLDSV
ncbi:MarR family transcriptional regulator, 2-MHQ and catechol-resistance regulon repressor [Desulfotomaculum arcticum]|uniref:MarR family transcriptional regulator, 2-MHQ and catechol-resistance regulon repressor n=1 Tax=Desulfotruncus arcticus DSM 17038 TaxID=1121424 RepID=A0A1I2VV16_9FIRM|nr:MarR family transcriptional regulator, 2-MHQ and catechol-resistance regulon repressor [Desulfotomaculum arcticum] [Desulfotruncus arcticus DSM 17038]